MVFRVVEKPMKSSDINISWGLKSGKKKIPTIPCLSPEGRLEFKHFNVGGNGMQLSSYIEAKNLLKPDESLKYKIEYDRAGLDISLKENYSRNSRGSFSLIAESISCMGEINQNKNGPPNTISNSGSDKII